MTSGSLTDLDPPAAPDRRWPFYVAWLVGGSVVGAVLLSHVPASVTHRGPAPVAEPAATEAPAIPTSAPGPPRILFLPPAASPLRVVAPVPIADVPARP
jgi:hypothetical protein